jgi:hypothetical protein
LGELKRLFFSVEAKMMNEILAAATERDRESERESNGGREEEDRATADISRSLLQGQGGFTII